MSKSSNAQEYIAHQRVMLASNPDCGTTHYNLAVALLGIKEFEEAEEEFYKAVDCSPTLVEAYVQLGGICLHRGDLEGCLDFNRRATKSRAGFAEGYGNIGFVEMQRGNLDEAIKNLRKAIIHNTMFIQAWVTLGSAYLQSGLLEESIKATLKAIEIQPDFPIAHNNLAIAYLENNEPEKAIVHIDKALSLGYEVAPQILEELEPHRK